jgi:hypothetical protein
MESLKEERDTIENVIKFIDSTSKALEGLRDKFSTMILEGESKNEKPEGVLQNWVRQAHNILREKFEEVYEYKYDEVFFKNCLKNWMTKYKDNAEFILNAKFLFKNLQIIRNTIKTKITASDSLSYMNLTDVLISKTKLHK